jgi:Abortive infection alpha
MAEDMDNKVPVVQRAFGSAADNFGKEIAPVGKELGIVTAKVARLLISGLDKSVYGLETVGAWIQEKVSERLRSVPEEKIVEPNPRIAVPATQALIYSMNDELIREMFANLLAADMNVDTKSGAHPAFVEMIREMTNTDARVLEAFRSGPQIEFSARFSHADRWAEVGVGFSFDITDVRLDQVRTAVSNLRRLEVIELRTNEWPVLQDLDERRNKFKNQFAPLDESIKSSPESVKHLGFGGPPNLSVMLHGLYPTAFGQQFISICLRS